MMEEKSTDKRKNCLWFKNNNKMITFSYGKGVYCCQTNWVLVQIDHACHISTS